MARVVMINKKATHNTLISATSLKTARMWTTVVMLLALINSFFGVYYNSLYNDNTFIKAVWRGNDAITLFIVVPILLFVLKGFSKTTNPKRSLLLWLGTLWYIVYNYIFYVYGATFNMFFLSYILIIIAAAIAIFQILIGLNIKIFIGKNAADANYKGVSLFLTLFAAVLGVMWVGMAGSYLFTAQVPEAIIQTGHPTGVVFATDLIFLVTPLLILAYYLRKNIHWAIILTPVILIKCVLYPLVLVAAGIFSYLEVGFYDRLTPLYLVLGFGTYLTLKKMLHILEA